MPAISGRSSSISGLKLRADARRNRDQLLLAARDVFVEHGPDAPLDEVARRAGVGIATLYRRFPDREALMRAVALDVLGRVGGEARQALAEEPDPFQALVRYMHAALRLRIAAVMPALVGRIPLEDDEIHQARDAAVEPVQRLLAAAQAEGRLRPDVDFGDVGLMLIRLSRPLPGPFPRQLNDSLAHRHLDLYIEGLRCCADRPPDELSGPAMSLVDLRTLQPPDPSTRARRPPPPPTE
jgi:AcrR family transcriptional regulator